MSGEVMRSEWEILAELVKTCEICAGWSKVTVSNTAGTQSRTTSLYALTNTFSLTWANLFQVQRQFICVWRYGWTVLVYVRTMLYGQPGKDRRHYKYTKYTICLLFFLVPLCLPSFPYQTLINLFKCTILYLNLNIFE